MHRAPVRRAVVTLLGVSASLSAQPFQFSGVALSGQAIPGGGASYQSFGVPVINDSGQVAFAGVDSTSAGITVAGSPGSLDLRTRVGAAVPANVGSGVWGGTQDPFILADGRIGFYGVVVTQQSLVRGLYFSASAAQTAVLADNAANPPAHPPGSSVGSFQVVGATGSGIGVLQANLQGGPFVSTDDSGLWAGTPGALALRVTTRMALPGPSAFAATLLGPGAINDSGTMAFFARSDTLVTVGGVSQRDAGVWLSNGSGISPVLRVGDQAPGMAPGVPFSGDIDRIVSINDAGQVAFRGVFRQAPGPYAEGEALWMGAPGNLGLVAARGQRAPGTPAPTVFSNQYTPVTLAANGAIGFIATLENEPLASGIGQGCWMRNAAGQTTAVALHNTPAPGAGPGIDFGLNMSTAMNASGLLALISDLQLTGTTSIVGQGLYVADGSGIVTKVFQTGETIQLGNGVFRTLSSFSFASGSGGQDGRASPFNASGQLALLAQFTNGQSGIVIATIPAPASGGLLLLSACAGLARRRRNSRA